MNHVPMKTVLATAMFSGLLAGCATTLDVGPGYYHYSYDVPVAHRTETVVTTAPTVVYREPAVVYREPTVVYRTAPVF
jgi:hypothetical protein